MLGNVPNCLIGFKIILSEYAGRNEPVKVHEKKAWMSSSYHRRIQKKWKKRFGNRLVPELYVIGNEAIVIHPLLLPKLKEILELKKFNSI